MNFKNYIIGILLFSFVMSYPQTQDTLLNTVLSKPFFYNIIKTKQNKFYLGTSQGIYELTGTSLKNYSEEKGYIATNKEGKPVIDSNGIKYHRSKSYNHLLPYKNLGNERSYHAGNDNSFYLCSGGRLYTFDIIPYNHSYQNHSIRSISKDFIGTYSGIYLKNKKLDSPAPTYTDSHIRQIDGRGFICSHSLFILEKDAITSGNVIEEINFFSYSEPDNLLISDITKNLSNNNYIISSQNKLIEIDYDFKKQKILFNQKKIQKLPIQLFPGSEDKLFFSSNNKLFSLNYKSNIIKPEISLKEPIVSGTCYGSVLYLLTNNALYRYISDGKLELLISIKNAHSLLNILGDQIIIGSDNCLLNYNLVSKSLDIVIDNVEFNRGALYLEENKNLSQIKIHAGSINGLYSFEISKIPVLINKNILNNESELNKTYLIFSIVLIFLSISLLWSIYFYQKKLKIAHNSLEISLNKNDKITRKDIENFIINNLADASIKSIMNKFDLNAPQIYNLLHPDKPGIIIQNMRLEKINRMRNEGKSLEDISKETGFSISYLKKIKAKK